MKQISMDFCPRDPGFSGCNTLQSDLVEEYGTRYAICDQSRTEDKPFQVILMDSDFTPLDSADFDYYHQVEKWLQQRGIRVNRNRDVEEFLES